MKKHGKISKGILILIIVICVLAVLTASAVGVYFFDKQNKISQEKILDDVANSMSTSSNFDSETKTTGKFAIVENALKEYYTECLNTSNDLVSIYSKNLLANSLTASNISSDGPEFTKTKENINKIKGTETSTLAKYDELISDEYISSKASELNLSEYYSNLFIDKINQNLKVKEDVNTLKEIVSEYDKWLDDINNVFDFLNTNKANWKISGNNVMFTNVKLVSQYNSLISDLSKQESVLNIKLKSLNTN